MEALVDLANALGDHDAGGPAPDIRAMLTDHAFTRAATAPAAQVDRVEARLRSMIDMFQALADSPASRGEHFDPRVDATVERINRELATITIAPSIVEHDGAPLHIHWTGWTAAFDDQVIADVLMALAQEVCDHGTSRFGRCAANDCEHMFFDATRNGSRRFCSDPRCASRTHTADHRARRRGVTTT